MSSRVKRGACILGIFQGVYRGCENGRHYEGKIKINIRCGRWDCPICGPRKAKKVYSRVMKGQIYLTAKYPGRNASYAVKLLTLTCPGLEYRALHTPDQAAREMQEAWSKLRKELSYIYGQFYFLRVLEAQKNGYPHLHVLMVGDAIASKNVYDDISRLWRELYGMGFMRINVVDSPEQAIKYVLKYLFKSPDTFKGSRLFSNSKGALLPCWNKEKKQWIESEITWQDWVKGVTGQDVDVIEEKEFFPILEVPF